MGPSIAPRQHIPSSQLTQVLYSQTATAYQSKFAESLKIIAAQTLKHRLWLSDRWTDTEAGKGQEVKLLEYACGPGVVSMVSVFMLLLLFLKLRLI
jgi:hypothetical protein